MSDMRNLISKLDRIDERQNHRELNGVVDQYAKQGMTLQDLAAMEQAAREMQTSGQGFLGGLGAALRSVGQTEDFKVNYVLYHAGEKLGLNGMFGTDGKLRTLNGTTYNSEEVRPTNAGARNIAVAQARLGVLPTNVQTKFSIQAGGQGETMRPTREFFFDPTVLSLQGHSISNFRGTEPYIDVTLQGELTRVYTKERNAEALREAYPDATVMKADGSGPYFQETNSSGNPTSGNNAAGIPRTDSTAPRNRERDGGNPGGTTTVVEPTATAAAAAALEPTGDEYKTTLDDFVAPASNQGGLRNNPEAAGAIKELNTRLSTLGFTNVQADSEEYSRATDQAIRDFQRAYNRMQVGTTNTDNAAVPETIRVDGDLGPNTYRALQDVENTFSTIQRLLAANGTTESITFKSSISKMIESLVKEALTQAQMGELTGKLIAIDKFIGAAGANFNIDSKKQMLINARKAVSANVANMSTEPTPNIVGLSNGEITPIRGSQTSNATDGKADAVQTGSDAGRYLAQLIHDAVEDGFVRADGNQIIERLEQVRNRQDYLDAVEAYQELYKEDMIKVLGNAAMHDTRFYPRYYEQLQRLEIPHILPDNPSRLRGGLMTGREWDEIFGEDLSKYNVNADSKYEYILGNAQTGAETDKTFDWGQRTGNTVSGEVTQQDGRTIRWEITVENEQVTMRVGRNLELSNVNIRQSSNGVTPFEAISNGKSQIYQMPNPEYQNLNDALEYVRDNMLETA